MKSNKYRAIAGLSKEEKVLVLLGKAEPPPTPKISAAKKRKGATDPASVQPKAKTRKIEAAEIDSAEIDVSERKRLKNILRSRLRKKQKQQKRQREKPTEQKPSKSKEEKTKLQEKVEPEKSECQRKAGTSEESFREKLLNKLSGAKFRHINETLYTTTGQEAQQLFKDTPALFDAYHTGYTRQIAHWPINPLDLIIGKIKKMPKTTVIADMGCGEGRLAKSVKQKVYSFDLVSRNSEVTAADISNVPLGDQSVDLCVFCLSLMGTNLADYLIEANRILKPDGRLKIAEIKSRFEAVGKFVSAVEKLGFAYLKKKIPNDYFILIDFKKISDAKKRNPGGLKLRPCLYKKR